MARPWILTSILLLLGIALWSSDEFTTIAEGIAVFLFGMIFLKDGFTAFTGGVLWKSFSERPQVACSGAICSVSSRPR